MHEADKYLKLFADLLSDCYEKLRKPMIISGLLPRTDLWDERYRLGNDFNVPDDARIYMNRRLHEIFSEKFDYHLHFHDDYFKLDNISAWLKELSKC